MMRSTEVAEWRSVNAAKQKRSEFSAPEIELVLMRGNINNIRTVAMRYNNATTCNIRVM